MILFKNSVTRESTIVALKIDESYLGVFSVSLASILLPPFFCLFRAQNI